MKISVLGSTILAAGEKSPAASSQSLLKEKPSVLVLSPREEDHSMLSRVFAHTAWMVHHSRDLEAAMACLREYSVSVVLCDCFFDGYSWKNFPDQLSQHPSAPTLIVASDIADGRLWAEVLNLGGYDVLAKPFSLPEVIWVVLGAHRRWRSRAEIAAGM